MTDTTDEKSARQLIDRLDGASTIHRTPCGEGSMVWREWGAPSSDAQTVVMLHGGFGSWLHWIRNIEAVSARYRLLVADIPGLGDSDSAPAPVTPGSLGEIVSQGLNLIAGTAPLHLVAFSFGGVVAGQAAIRLNAPPRSLTLAGASGMGLRREKMLLIRRTEDMSEEERQAANLENLKRLMIKDVRNIDSLAVVVHSQNDARARLASRRMSFGDSLAIALKTLGTRGVQLNGIWGEHDVTAAPWIDARQALLKEHCATSNFNTIRGAGHWVAYEAADTFNETFLQYV